MKADIAFSIRFRALLAAGLAVFASATNAAPISYTDLLARPRPVPTATIAYGQAPEQRGELFLPVGKGPFPVFVLVHGGCWRATLPGPELLDYIAADLQRRGYAVWNIDYRRVGNPGGGYPGAFPGVAGGIGRLRP